MNEVAILYVFVKDSDELLYTRAFSDERFAQDIIDKTTSIQRDKYDYSIDVLRIEK